MLTALLGGGLLTAAYPLAGLSGLAWIAPAVLAWAVFQKPKEAFRLGYCFGLSHFLPLLYWLLYMPYPPGAVAAWVALCAYLSLFTGAWAWFLVMIAPGSNDQGAMQRFAEAPFRARALWCLHGAAGWVALEFTRGWLLSGFPWNGLGVSQFAQLSLIQFASILGVPGISFVVCWVSLALFLACVAFASAAQTRVKARLSGMPRLVSTAWLADLAVPVLVLVGLLAWGSRRVSEMPARKETRRLALIQPSIPQRLIWDERESTNRFQSLIRLSELALASKPDALIWPEAAVPNMIRHNPETADAVQALLRSHPTWLIAGSDDAARRPGAVDDREVDYFNAAFAISPDARIEGSYNKRKLVMFGEYVPLARWLPFLKMLTPIGDSGFTAGKEVADFKLGETGIHTSPLICFEDTFAEEAREHVADDTDFLVNLTNDGWFGGSAAQWQHTANAAFRAVENGVPLVRCTNNGITCWIDASGRWHDVGFDDGRDVYSAGFKIVEVPVLGKGAANEKTVYRKYGDWFGWVCSGWVAGYGAGVFQRKRRV